MASRRIALNLQKGLRNRLALKSVRPLQRGFATPANLGSKTESTTLTNGFTVRLSGKAGKGWLLTAWTDRD
jgi:mitochondrial-processing peptidase subunit beta